MEPLGKTWALSYIEQIKLKKLKDRRLYAVKALEDRLHCFDKKDTRNCLASMKRPDFVRTTCKHSKELSTTIILKQYRFIDIELVGRIDWQSVSCHHQWRRSDRFEYLAEPISETC